MKKFNIYSISGEGIGTIDLQHCKTDLEVLWNQEDWARVNEREIDSIIFEEIEEPAQGQTRDRVILPVVFSSYTPLKDKSLNIRFNTGEASDDTLVRINRLMNTNGVLIYRNADKVNEDDLQTIDKLDLDLYDAPKSLSKRLKSVLWLAWQKDNRGHTTADDYYKSEMEKVITHFKKRLDD